MLQTLQLLALVQGLFLLTVIFKNKKRYKKTVFWLFVGSIFTVQMYILGDDDNNFLFEHADLFFFDITLFITFLFLFIKYKTKPKTTFSKKDLLYFTPNVIYLTIEILELQSALNNTILESFELLVELTFLSYFAAIIGMLYTSKSEKWMLYFMVPMIITVSLSISNEILALVGLEEFWLFSDEYFNSSMVILVALLFYAFSFKLIISPKEVLPNVKPLKYKTSSLATREFSAYQKELVALMKNEKLYMNPKLSIHDVAQKLKVPRQHISEVLNVHMHVGFQDFINEYRVEAFINCLQKEQYTHYTLFGIANEVGFNSKSSFNTTFKKIKGLTPSQFKKTLLVTS
jgi:AraC-like DNA-binding protein